MLERILKKKPIYCKVPFLHIFIAPSDDIYSCPDTVVHRYSDIYIGNLTENSFKKIWFSKSAKKIRKNVLNRKSDNCKICDCANRTNFHLHVLYNFNKENPDIRENGYPLVVTFGEDIKGIDNCKMAKDGDFEINAASKDRYFDALKHAKEVVFSHRTDPFSNKTTSDFIIEIAQKYPKLKFNLVSNGILFTKENTEKLLISDRLSNVLIYVNAQSRETYDKFVQNGDFEVLKQNLSRLKDLKKAGRLKNLFLAFVVDKNNFREMPQFVDFAREYDAYALFWLKVSIKFRNWNILEKDDLINIENEDYVDFIKVLNSTSFNTKNSGISADLTILRDYY